MKGLCIAILLLIQTVYASEIASVKRGAQSYMQYCYSCHSLQYVRYDRVLDDLALPGFTGILPLPDVILSRLPAQQAETLFGRMPPDLSLKSKEKGKQWITDYLNGFYTDPSRPFGVNNHILPNTTMPNVLGSLSPEEREATIQDLTAFLEYAAEPAVLMRYTMGIKVLLFLFILGFLVFRIYKNYQYGVE